MLTLQNILGRHDLHPTPKSIEINEYLSKHLSPYRYEHTLKVLEFALDLALPVTNTPEIHRPKNNRDDFLSLLTLAALGHDITKEQPPEFHRELFQKYGRPDYAELPPPLFHSKSAVFFLAEKFHIDEEMIFHAVSYHSTGCSEMPRFSRIIFCADYLATKDYRQQPGEASLTRPADRENLSQLCLDKLGATITYLMDKKLPVQPESINFYNILVKEIQVTGAI